MGAPYDFRGWATRNDIRCSDGRTIRKNAFKDDDGCKVPLVWNHQHNDPSNVLGHALLENREEGVYAYCTFNDTDAGQSAKSLVQHGDVTSLSIYANQLRQQGGDVLHGAIREVSLVLAGANPGAYIESIISHSDTMEEDAIIYTNEEITLEHSDMEDDNEPNQELNHSAEKKDESDEGEETVGDVLNTLNEKQKTAVYAIIAQALEDGAKNNKDSEGGKEEMKHNVFDNDQQNDAVLEHTAMETIIADGKRYGSMKESFLAHAEEYGIQNIDWLFPEAKSVNGNAPQFIKRTPDGWVHEVMSGVHHTPFAKIKMMFADLREDEARAKGYIKGKLKKEEVFGLLRRSVDPTTIYKKQKMDRDDVIDITDFDVIAWLKGEMRLMLDEEIARAILFGDGRSAMSDDKIDPTKIIPICADADLYTIKQEVTPAADESFAHAFIDAAVRGQNAYEGSGNTRLFVPNTTVTEMLLLEDKDGHRLYKDVKDIAVAMSVDKIIKVPASIVPTGVYGVIVDLKDYNVGADKGGSINMFDDFDIDYNQQKYLIETRCSGALVKPFSAIVLKAAE